MKTKTITLTDGHAPEDIGVHITNETDWRKASRFLVMQITDSIEFHIGQYLSRDQVEQLCDSKHWKVTIKAWRAQ